MASKNGLGMRKHTRCFTNVKKFKNWSKVSNEEAESLTKELKLKLFKVSLKEGIQVEECFEYFAIKHYNNKGSVSSGAENIEDVQKEIKIKRNNSNDNEDIEELPSQHKKMKNIKKRKIKIAFQKKKKLLGLN